MSRRWVIVSLLLVLVSAPGNGEAGWLFGDEGASNRSGLDLRQGYDRNTVVTLTGRVTVAPSESGDPVTVELAVGGERLTVVVAPRWYVQDDNLDWKVGDSLTVRGSRAQGKDGRIYLLAQWLTTPGGSGQLVLRSDSGRPGWSGGGMGGRGGQSGMSGGGQAMPSGGAGRRMR